MSRVDESRFEDESFLLSSDSANPTELSPQGPRSYTRLAGWLAIAAVISTFWAGVGAGVPTIPFQEPATWGTLRPVRQAILANWFDGMQFSLALMAILVAHEFGHYLFTLYYKVPSTPPLFIPFPLLSPIGTMGAVIMMQSGTANRRQIFDIGIAGPLAGLLVAIPIIVWGILDNSKIHYAPADTLVMGQPLLIQWLGGWLVPENASAFVSISNGNANPLLMAGWVGLLVTGLNMVPLGQLDGGHVAFGLLGQRSYWVALAALAGAIGYMLYSQVWIFSLMLVLVMLMGVRHPPSSDDSKELGVGRQTLGWLTLSLPVLCIPANPIDMLPVSLMGVY